MTDLPTAAPENVGVDSGAVSAFLAAADAAPGIELHGFLLARHGRRVAGVWWDPYGPDLPHLLYSGSKTFTALAYAFAETEGLIGRDDPLIGFWPEHAAVAGPRARRWTPRLLLRMASGHTRDWMMADADAGPAIAGLGTTDAVARAFAHEPDREPGSVWCYNQLATYLVAATVERVTGQGLVDYLRPRLFEPFGVRAAHWQTDNRGRALGFTGLHVPLDALLKLGELHLRRGEWGGRRLLPASWFDEASRALSDTATPVPHPAWPPAPDWEQGYGYQLWRSRHGYRADGAFGQFALVLPDQDAVVALNAQTPNMQTLLDLVWDLLLPGLGARTSAGRTAGALDAPADGTDAGGGERRLPPRGGDGPDASFVATEETYVDERGTFPVPVRALRVTRTGGDWRLDLASGGLELAVAAGDGRWLSSELAGREGTLHVRASAGWSAGTFHAVLVLVTTPHSVLIAGDVATGSLTSRWVTPPLRGLFPTDLALPG